MAKNRPTIESIRSKMRRVAEDAKMSQQEIGEAMGFSSGGARQAVSRLLNPRVDYDPRLSTLLAFSQAIKRPLSDLL